jgi:hypothetical protein
MSVSFITGKPGGGKSFLATRVIIKELVSNPDTYVITNVPLKPQRIVEYAVARYGSHINPARIKVLSEEETKVFFLHRSGGHVAPKPADGTDGHIEYEKCVGPDGETRNAFELMPVLYVIDEAHLHFGSRDWAKTGKSAMFYLSQHRKMGDNVIFVTQSWKNVDAQFRRVAQDFTVCVNLAKRKAFGFKMPSVFTLRTYDSEPTPYALEVSTEAQRMDVDGLGSCYDTAAGVGIAGRAADTKQEKKGLPWQLAVGLGVLFIAALVFVPIAIGDASKRILGIHVANPAVTNSVSTSTNTVPVTKTNTPVIVPAAVIAPQTNSSPALPLTATRGPNGLPTLTTTNGTKFASGPKIEPEPIQKVKFFVRSRGFVMLGMDNGDVFTVGDGRLQIAGKLAIIDGNRAYRLPE